MKTIKLLILMVFALCTFACANDSEDDFVISEDIENPDDVENPDDNGEEGEEEEVATVTYVDDIEPIMSAACVACHSSPPINGAPFPLINFSQVRQIANGVFNRMNLPNGSPGVMPPSGRLPQATIDLVEQWIDAGTPEE